MAAQVKSEAVENIAKQLGDNGEIDGCALQREVENLRFGEKYQVFAQLQKRTVGKDAHLTVQPVNNADQIGFVVNEATSKHPQESTVFAYIKDRKDDSPPKTKCGPVSAPGSNTWLNELEQIKKIDG
jgi:hypothetical protein